MQESVTAADIATTDRVRAVRLPAVGSWARDGGTSKGGLNERP